MNVAVVIPTYNRGAMLVDAVESALAQSVACRVIVVDDGSTDDTPDRMAPYLKQVTYSRQPNRERGASRNTGAALAPEADLFIFLDSDDAIAPDHVRGLVALARAHPTAPLVASRSVVTDERLTPLFTYRMTAPGPLTLEGFLCARQAIPPPSAAVRAAAFARVGTFDEERALSGSEDWLLFARLLVLGDGVRGVGRTALIRQHGNNTMGNARGMRRTMTLARHKFFATYRDAPPALVHRSLARMLINSATAFYGTGCMREARTDLRLALDAWPLAALDPVVPWTLFRSLLGAEFSAALRRHKRALQRVLRRDVTASRS